MFWTTEALIPPWRIGAKPVKVTLATVLDAKEAAEKVGWALPEDAESRLEYLAPLWSHVRWFARIFLGAQRAEPPFLHTGFLCVSRIREKSFEQFEFIVQERWHSSHAASSFFSFAPRDRNREAEVCVPFPIMVLPGIESAGSEEAVNRQMEYVLKCLRSGFYRYFLRESDKTSLPPASTGSCLSQDTGEFTRNSEVKVAPNLKDLVDCGCIRDVHVTSSVDFQNKPRFLWMYLNVIFNIEWDLDKQVGGSKLSADRFALIEKALLRPLEAYLTESGEARGVHVRSKNRGKNTLFRVLSQVPSEWKLEVEYLMALSNQLPRGGGSRHPTESACSRR
mmetsp:Transcript_50310/g.99070  ORF Transcript_50310/g.99070 Transcript_50310/m.99070 type:complete len:336 (-) Transcript_50310:963-1970(-)